MAALLGVNRIERRTDVLRSSALTTHHMPRLQVSDSPESRSTMPQQRGAAGLEMMEAVQQARLCPP